MAHKNQYGPTRAISPKERERIKAAFREGWGWTKIQETFKRGQGTLVKLRSEALGGAPARNEKPKRRILTPEEEGRVIAAFRAGQSYTAVGTKFKITSKSTLKRLHDQAHARSGRATERAPKSPKSAVIDWKQWYNKLDQTKPKRPTPKRATTVYKESANYYHAQAANEILRFLVESKEVTEAGKRLLRAALEVMP